jgi:hypothetical protein
MRQQFLLNQHLIARIEQEEDYLHPETEVSFHQMLNKADWHERQQQAIESHLITWYGKMSLPIKLKTESFALAKDQDG